MAERPVGLSKPAPKAANKTANAPSDKKGLESRKAAATVLARIIDDGRGLDGLLDSRHGPAPVSDEGR